MAGVSGVLRDQLGAVAQLRFRLSINSLRRMRGRLELASKIFTIAMFSLAGLGLGTGCGFVAWNLVHDHSVPWLAAPLWFLFLLRQFLPLLVNSFTDSLDLSSLLRLPLDYRAFFLIRLTFGLFDAGSILSTLGTLGLLVGITIADVRLLIWALPVLAIFLVLNAVIERAISTWVDRWMAQRRTREIVAAISFLFLFSLQLIGPLSGRHFGGHSAAMARTLEWLAPVEQVLPPGAAAAAINAGSRHQATAAGESVAVMLFYLLGSVALLHMRLSKEYRGENLSETALPSKASRVPARVSSRSQVETSPVARRATSPLAALLEKELRYLSRSGPLWFTLITPVFFLLVFGSGRRHEFLPFLGSMWGFPIAAAYILMVLTNLMYNNFGSDEAGVQVYFMLPVPMRTVIAAKNLVHAAILVLEMLAAWLVVSLLFHSPALVITLATVLWTIFAAAVNLSVGNLLSLAMPKKTEPGKFGRQKPATASAFIGLGVQAVTVGAATLVVFLSRLAGSLWIVVLVFGLLAAAALAGYYVLLRRLDDFAARQREPLIATLSRV